MADSTKYIEKGSVSLKKYPDPKKEIIEFQFDDFGDAKGAANFLTNSKISNHDDVHLNASPPSIYVTSHRGLKKLYEHVSNNPDLYPKTTKALSGSEIAKEIEETKEGDSKIYKDNTGDKGDIAEDSTKKWSEKSTKKPQKRAVDRISKKEKPYQMELF